MTARLRATILGCGASPGVPRIGNDWGACDPDEPRNRRTRCSLLLERFEDGDTPTRVLVDTGPDLREQLLSANVGFLDAVIYTHAHADHLHGIDDLRAFWMNTKQLLDIHADADTWARIDQAFGYCFTTPAGSSYPPTLRYRPMAIGTPVTVTGAGGALSVMPFRQTHGGSDSLGLRVGGLAYSCDISDVPAESLSYLEGLDVWIVDALRYTPHPSHFDVHQALDWIARIKPQRALLTHMHTDLDYQTLKASLPSGIEPAWDGAVLELPLD
mgnify:CR=1 FL=1